MASEAKIAANRRNAARSTGPKTGAGKAIASLNALKTGTYAKTSSLMPGEDREAYGKIEQEIYAQMMPVGPIEEECVRSIIEDLWKLERLRRLEAVIMTRHAKEYCLEQYICLMPWEKELFLDRLFDDDEVLPPSILDAENKDCATLRQYVQEEMREKLGENEAVSKSKNPESAKKIEIIFDGFSDSDLMFEAHAKSNKKVTLKVYRGSVRMLCGTCRKTTPSWIPFSIADRQLRATSPRLWSAMTLDPQAEILALLRRI